MTEGLAQLGDIEAQMADVAKRAADVANRMEQIRPSASSSDNAVTVSVTGSGTLAGISFGSAARDMDLEQLARLIMRTAAEAHRAAALQTRDALTELVGHDTPAIRAMDEVIPPADDTPDEPTGPQDPAAAAARDTVPRPQPAAPTRPPVEDVDDTEDGFTGRGQA